MNIPKEAVEAAAQVFERHSGVRDTLAMENVLEAAAPSLLAVGLGSLADYFEEMASLSSYRSGADVTGTWLEAASHARSQAAHIREASR